MSTIYRVGFLGVILLAGCGDSVASGTSVESSSGGSMTTGDTPTTSGAEPTTAEPVLPECQDGDSVWVESALEACVDPSCAEVEANGFMAMATEIDGEFYADVAFECQVESALKQDGEQWTLTDCTGEEAPASGAIRITFTNNQGFGLPLVIGERVRVAFHGGSTYNNDHRSWSLRRTDDTLLALATFGIFLPPAELAAPLKLKGEPQQCGTPGGCGGYVGRSNLAVELGDDLVKVPDDAVGILAGDPSYQVVVALASYEGPSGCGIFGWRESYIFAVVGSL